MIGLVALLIFLSLGLIGYAVSASVREREEARQTQARRLSSMTGASLGTLDSPLLKDRRLSSIEVFNTLLKRMSFAEPVARMLRQARLERRAGEIFLYMALLACAGFLLTVFVGAGRFLGVLFGALAGAIPLMIVQRTRRKRAQLFSDQLPDALDLIRAALQAGHGFLSALNVVADEFPNPIAEEFRDVAEEMRLGLPMRDALYNLVSRIDDDNLPILVVGVLVAHEVGGNLAEVLENISHTIRERFKLKRETQVLTAQGRLSGRLLTALPFFVGIVMNVLNPAYFAPMLKSSTGIYMLGYAAFSIVLGHLIIRRLVDIKV
jgi:tight adherence protein B